MDSKDPILDVLSSAPSAPQLHAALPTSSSMPSVSPRMPLRKSCPSARRRELVWKSQRNETLSLEEIASQFQSFLITFSTELGFNRRRGRYTTKTAHRCPGYNRIEITLTPDIAHSAIVSHLTPIPHEICPVCKEIVKDAEIFACICGGDGKSHLHKLDHSSCVLTSSADNESIPTIRCSTCSEWHHRPCVSIPENKGQSFVCRRCKVRKRLSSVSSLGQSSQPELGNGVPVESISYGLNVNVPTEKLMDDIQISKLLMKREEKKKLKVISLPVLLDDSGPSQQKIRKILEGMSKSLSLL